jgi:uncharacterized protein YndB with AHSA1/START domain
MTMSNAKMHATSDHSQEFVMSRVIHAPRERVFAAWTDVGQLKRWFGPKGFVMFSAALDLRPGGTFLYGLRSPQGQDMWGKWTFREIVKPERLSLIISFSDPQGGVTRHPLNADWPRETLSNTTFAEQNGKTTVSLRWSPLNATPAEQAAFAAGHEGMQQGWSGTMEQLEAFLAVN